jgi:hypothetical protein
VVARYFNDYPGDDQSPSLPNDGVILGAWAKFPTSNGEQMVQLKPISDNTWLPDDKKKPQAGDTNYARFELPLM